MKNFLAALMTIQFIIGVMLRKWRSPSSLLAVLLFFVLAGVVPADTVPVETAEAAVIRHLDKVRVHKLIIAQQQAGQESDVGALGASPTGPMSVTDVYTEQSGAVPVYYVMNLSPEGWVIIAADDAAYPIIAYSLRGSCSMDPQDMAPGFAAWMKNVSADITNAINQNMEPLPEAAEAWRQLRQEGAVSTADITEQDVTAVEPLLKTTWSQGGKPYFEISNNPLNWIGSWYKTYDAYCPWEKNWAGQYRVAPTGCTATAVAQVMKYWRWPPVGKGSKSWDPPFAASCDYGCTYGEETVNFAERRYNWSIMPASVGYDGNGNPAPYEGGLAVARLMRDIGVAMEMDYEPSGSAAHCDLEAMKDYFRYDDSLEKKKRSVLGAAWEGALIAELNVRRPIVYYGCEPDGSSAHSFVCDGYSMSGEYFHFNWGWGGSHDGYYSVSSLTPGDFLNPHDYTDKQFGLFNLQPDYSNTVWVDDNYSSDGSNDGHVWGVDAFNNIQAAIIKVDVGGTVNVESGVYYSPISCSKDVKLLGAGASSTTIMGHPSLSYGVITVSNLSASSIIDGFTVTGGNSTTIGRGGGLWCNSSSLTVSNCVFQGNSADSFGDGIAIEGGGSPVITDCTFNSNGSFFSTYVRGGGIYCDADGATIKNCVFYDNKATISGGALHCQNCSPLIVNCVFCENGANSGGGVCCDNADPDIVNCTFYKNGTAGLYCSNGSNPNVANCIFDGNTNGQISSSSGSPVVTYSCVQGGYPGVGNIDEPPLFAGDSDLHLTEGSWCIDAGSNAALPAGVTADVTGAARIVNGDGSVVATVDMGAYEFPYGQPGDCDRDFDVDLNDFACLVGVWMDTGCGGCGGADYSGDDDVDLDDLQILCHNWLQSK